MTAPLSPSADEARRLLERELAKSEYQASKPGLLDRAAQAILDWFSSIRFGTLTGTPAIVIVVLLVLVAAALVVIFAVYGLPRLHRRSRDAPSLFGDDDVRTAGALRSSADRAAQSGDFTQAIVELYRAIARDLGERGVITTSPGTTAHDFGERAAALFPAHGRAIRRAAAVFDDVRYLDRPGSESAYRDLRDLDTTLEKAEPSSVPDGVPA